MILIADSGSTKCDWALVRNGETILQTSTMGFNPYFHDETLIANNIRWNEELKKYREEVSHIYYYGAGCSSPDLNQVVESALESVFRHAKIVVDHDMIGAAHATCQGEPGIACILGTGSNSCMFDGEKVYEEVPALAYILGDEGSGSYHGKKLLAMYLYKQLPEHLHQDLEQTYHLSKDVIMEHVYMKPNANVYLASFMKFISRHKEEPLFQKMVLDGMTHFLSIHVQCFENYRSVPTHFVGSIAHHFEKQLREAAQPLDVTVGRIVKKPIEGLVEYHRKHSMEELSDRA